MLPRDLEGGADWSLGLWSCLVVMYSLTKRPPSRVNLRGALTAVKKGGRTGAPCFRIWQERHSFFPTGSVHYCMAGYRDSTQSDTTVYKWSQVAKVLVLIEEGGQGAYLGVLATANSSVPCRSREPIS